MGSGSIQDQFIQIQNPESIPITQITDEFMIDVARRIDTGGVLIESNDTAAYLTRFSHRTLTETNGDLRFPNYALTLTDKETLKPKKFINFPEERNNTW